MNEVIARLTSGLSDTANTCNFSKFLDLLSELESLPTDRHFMAKEKAPKEEEIFRLARHHEAEFITNCQCIRR